MFNISVTLLRLLSAAWIGAAALFVITLTADQTTPDFDSMTRDRIATVEFPLYYTFGFAVESASILLAAAAVVSSSRETRRRWMVVAGLLLLATVLMLLDYIFVYRALQELITPPGKARTADFITLHKWSRHANEVHITIAMIASLVACFPVRPVTTPDSTHSDGSE